MLNCVLTAGEGQLLRPMTEGLVRRYSVAGVTPPVVLYSDRDCCGGRHIGKKLFPEWAQLQVRLDVWHFMRRIGSCCNTEAHMLYPAFMNRLSCCIFEWDSGDVALLKSAKKAEMEQGGVSSPTDRQVMDAISRKELAMHCRRRTRGVLDTTRLLQDLLQEFTGPAGVDMTGMPLLDSERAKAVWDAQKKHVACLQDPEGVQLYARTGSRRKGGVELPQYRCARGSTSLESFHLHVNRFIPGECHIHLRNDCMSPICVVPPLQFASLSSLG